MWAHLARLTRHSSVSTAYETSVSLVQDTLLFAPTLQLQHTTLATNDDTQSIPLDYASYQVDSRKREILTLRIRMAATWRRISTRHYSLI
jgi:hypothetical protein